MRNQVRRSLLAPRTVIAALAAGSLLLPAGMAAAQADPVAVAPADPVAAVPEAKPAPPAPAAAAAPLGDAPGSRRYGVQGQAFLGGQPVRGGKVTVWTTGGTRLRTLQPATTTRSGFFQATLRRVPMVFVVRVRGGRVGQRSLGSTTLASYGDLRDPIAYVNMGSTLLVDYRSLHPRRALPASVRAVARYLSLPVPTRRPTYTLGQSTHVSSRMHDPVDFWSRARRAGGVDAYLNRLARRVPSGTPLTPSLRSGAAISPTFGKDGTAFPATTARATTRAGQRAGLVDAFTGLLQWAAGNAATSAACADATSNVAQALLACPATASASSGIATALTQMQSQLNNVSDSLNTIQNAIANLNLNTAVTDSGLSTLQAVESDLHGALVGIAGATTNAVAQQCSSGPAPCTAQTAFPATGLSSTQINTVCTAAYGPTTAAAGQTAVANCNTIGTNIWPAGKSGLADQMQTFFEYMAAWSSVDAGLTLPIAYQNALAGVPTPGAAATRMVRAYDQNQLNQAIGPWVGMQATLGSVLVNWQAFWETWTSGTGQALVCPSGSIGAPVSTVGLSFTDQSTCDLVTGVNTMLSIEQYISDNGARESLPTEYDSGTQASATAADAGAGTIIDTVGSMTMPPVWFSLAVDVSGQSLLAGNPYWPYVHYGLAPGQTVSSPGGNGPSGTWNPVTSPVGTGVLLPNYPHDPFAFGALPSDVQLVADALAASPSATSGNAALTDAGFIGPGQCSYMCWSQFVNGISTWTFAVDQSYPAAQNGSGGYANTCSQATGWPPSTATFAWPGGTSYACTDVPGTHSDNPSAGEQGTWGTSYINTATSKSSSSLLCSGLLHGASWGANPPPNIGSWNSPDDAWICIGPTSSNGPSYYSLLLDLNPASPVWTEAMIESWDQQNVTSYLTS